MENGGYTRADVCIVACAEVWRGDGAILASAIGVVPRLAAGLARLTFEPDLLVTDGQSSLVAGDGAVEGWMPFRKVFDVLWAGRRHVMMGASQIDKFGNSNISCIGDWSRPTRQLIGARGAPGNSINHPCSYWIAAHTKRTFVDRVDFVSGIGYDPALWPDGVTRTYHEVRRVVTNLADIDFEGPDHAARLRSVHPGVAVDEVLERTGFELVVGSDVPETRAPTAEELEIIRGLDPLDRRHAEVPEPAPKLEGATP
jgi:acyl CoA:acetate/3-ketoacid CoA transferase beta subunit